MNELITLMDEYEMKMMLKDRLEEKKIRNFLCCSNLPTSLGGVGDVCCCCRRPDARDHSTIKCRSFHVNPFNPIKARSASTNDL